MQYFYTPPECISNDKLEILGEEVVHITKSLRHKTGDKIKVTDGRGFEYTVSIEESRKDKLRCSIIEKHAGTCASRCKLTLFQTVPKQGRMDLIIEKATELGVHKIVPIITKYSICVPKNEENKSAHWNRIAINAMKQSMGTMLPIIDNVTNFSDAVKIARNFEFSLIAHCGVEVKHIKEALGGIGMPDIGHSTKIALFIGPEGGFSDEEIGLAIQNKIIPVSFGTKRLRSETAAIVGCALLLV